MLSMTGYGRGSAAMGSGRVVVEIKTVNHRFLEVRCRAPRELLLGETLVEKLLREKLARGYCTVNLWYEGVSGSAMSIDKTVASNHLKKLIEIGDDVDLCLADLIPILAGAPDLFAPPKPDSDDELKAAVEQAFEQAAVTLVDMRTSEGKAMAKDFKKILSTIKKDVEQLAGLAETWPQTAFDRIQDRMKVLFDKVGAELDKNRVEAEVAILVDKADINEEITRLRSHFDQMGELTKSKVPVGRQSEFLIQEIAREINTIASKASLTEIRSISVKIKTELEKVRELVQNIE